MKKLLSVAFLISILSTQLLSAQGRPSFTGVWKLSSERSQPSRKGDVTLKIDHVDPDLTVETTIARPAGAPRTAIQKYSTDGKQSTTTGADGDEFLTTVVWKGTELVFTIEEHEEGRTIRSKESWNLIEDGAAIQREREHADGTAKQTLIYIRQTPATKSAELTR